MAQDISALENEVAEEVTVMASATALINGFADRLREAGADPAKLAKLQSDLDSSGQSLAAAVAANTPAADGVITGDSADTSANG
jgi:hypothetical protein